MLRDEGLLDGDNFVETNVWVELGLDVAKGDDRAVSAVATVERRTVSGGVDVAAKGRKAYPNLPCASRAGDMATASWNVLRRMVSTLAHCRTPPKTYRRRAS